MQISMQLVFASDSLVDEIFPLMFSPGVTLVDSPGFNSSIADMEELVWLLADLQQVLLHRIEEVIVTCLHAFVAHIFCLFIRWTSLWLPSSMGTDSVPNWAGRYLLFLSSTEFFTDQVSKNHQ